MMLKKMFSVIIALFFGITIPLSADDAHDNAMVKTPFIYNIKELGADITGHDDSSDIIQKALNEIKINSGGVVYLPKGIYLLNSKLELYSNTRIVGDGATTILKAGDDVYGLINMSGACNVTISDLTLDGNVEDRDRRYKLNRCVSGIFADLCSKCEFRNIKFINLGYKPLTYSKESLSCGGNYLTLAVDNKGENGVNVAYNIVEDCQFIDEQGRASFGIRLWSNWELKGKNKSCFVEHNTIKHNKFIGFNWNCLELAGPCVRYNSVINNICENHYGWGCIEADKGASYNLFAHNTVKNISTSSPGTIYGYRDASDGVSHKPVGNKWVNNRVVNILQVANFSCGGMLVENSVDCQIDRLYIDNVSSISSKNKNVAGIFIDKSTNSTIKNCVITNCISGLYIIHAQGLNILSNRVLECKTGVKFMAGEINNINFAKNTIEDNLKAIQLSSTSRGVYVDGERLSKTIFE